MNVKQVASLVNDATKETLGETAVVNEDLSNIVDIGTEIFAADKVDNYVKSLINHIGKVIFVNRSYNGNIPSVLMDAWEFGSVLEKVSAELPEATENKSWDLQDGHDYSPNVFYKPEVSAKFFNSKTTFEVDMSFTQKQVQESFSSAEQINGFISMLYNAVDKSMTVKIDGLVMSTINNAIAQVLNNNFSTVADNNYSNSTSVQAVNLLKVYNDKFTKTLTKDDCLTDIDFLKFATMTISLYKDRVSKISRLFNVGKKARFTPKEDLHIVALADFIASTNTYLQADTFHNDLTSLPNGIETIPYWQGSGLTYSFTDTSNINVKINDTTAKKSASTKDINTSGILAVMFDHEALGVCNQERRVTTNYNPKAEFYSNFFKFDCGYFNDLDENFIVFFVA